MMNILDFIFRKRVPSILGIDIGTSSIKIVELKQENGRFRLTNYAVLEVRKYAEDTEFRGLSFDLRDTELAEKLRMLLKEGGFSSTVAVMSLPVFSTFVTVMEMPALPEKELATAVPLQAREYIPIPISEVVLDWKVVRTMKKSDLLSAPSAVPQSPVATSGEKSISSGESSGERKRARGARTEVLLMAAPREMVHKYSRLAEMTKLDLVALEIEAFSFARALALSPDAAPVVLVDMGAFNTGVTVIDEGYPRVVHNIGVSGTDLTRAVSRALGVDTDRGETYKRAQGLYAAGGESEIVTAYLPLLESLARDIERVISAYWRRSSRQVGHVILSGKAALLKGLTEYLANRLRVPTSLANPFVAVSAPKELFTVLPVMSLELATAIGLAMKEL